MMSHKEKYVDRLPDLITSEDYQKAHQQKKIRFQLKISEEGLEILGDSPYPDELDRLLDALDVPMVEKVLCG